jgi:glycosyltransferase involved in cell wall biosynthesis
MPGHVDDVAAALAAADIAVLPSEREGLPRFLLEAAAAGLPSIATDVPGNRDVIDHEVTGLLVPPHDPKALYTAITRLASDPALRRRMGAAAREKAEAQFSDAAIADVYLGMVIGVTDSEAS